MIQEIDCLTQQTSAHNKVTQFPLQRFALTLIFVKSPRRCPPMPIPSAKINMTIACRPSSAPLIRQLSPSHYLETKKLKMHLDM